MICKHSMVILYSSSCLLYVYQHMYLEKFLLSIQWLITHCDYFVLEKHFHILFIASRYKFGHSWNINWISDIQLALKYHVSSQLWKENKLKGFLPTRKRIASFFASDISFQFQAWHLLCALKCFAFSSSITLHHIDLFTWKIENQIYYTNKSFIVEMRQIQKQNYERTYEKSFLMTHSFLFIDLFNITSHCSFYVKDWESNLLYK